MEQLLGGDLAAHVGAFEQAVGQVALLLVQVDNLFFDRVFSHQAIDGDRALLADAMGAIKLQRSLYEAERWLGETLAQCDFWESQRRRVRR